MCNVLATAGDALEELMGSIDTLQEAAKQVMSSSALKKLVKLILYVGNFLNYGSQRVWGSGAEGGRGRGRAFPRWGRGVCCY